MIPKTSRWIEILACSVVLYGCWIELVCGVGGGGGGGGGGNCMRLAFSLVGLGTHLREEEKTLMILWIWEARCYCIRGEM
jgi:hypothetical protein